MNVTMALVWIASGAVALGAATAAVWRHRPGSTTMIVPGLVGLGSFLVAGVLLVLPVTTVSTIIDSAVQPVEVQCGGAWGALRGSPYIDTDAGAEFDPSHGACQAAAWRRVAALGTVELGFAGILATAVLVTRRRRHDAASTSDRVTV